MNRSRYDAYRQGNIIIIEDLNGPMSVTNDMENIIKELFMEHSDIKDCTVIYKDSDGIWDKVIVERTIPVMIVFAPIKPGIIITDLKVALNLINQ